MVWDGHTWKLTFHPKGMASEIGLDWKYRYNLGTSRIKPHKLEHLKDILAKALTMILDGGSQSPQIARPICPLLGKTPTSEASNVGYTASPELWIEMALSHDQRQ